MNTYIDSLRLIVQQSYHILRHKMISGGLKVDNEASFQLQFAYILKSIGQLYEFSPQDKFSISLENRYKLPEPSAKIKSKAKEEVEEKKDKDDIVRIDAFMELGNPQHKKTCAIELKYFQKLNQREPNNRYDVFAELYNMELYRLSGIDLSYLIIGTDHEHYVTKSSYSANTADFDFRNGKTYRKGTKLEYRTKKGYGPPLTLKNDYQFSWDIQNDLYFMILEIPKPQR